MSGQPRVAIIIVNWNGAEDTIECVESLQRVSYPNATVVVVDNASTGKDVQRLRTRFGEDIHLLANERNSGFAEGSNIGVRYAIKVLDPQYLLLLNNDTVVDPDFLTELVAVADRDSDIGLVGGKIYIYGTGLIDSAGSLFYNVFLATSRGNLEEDTGQYDYEEEVPMVTAGCCLIRRAILDGTYLFDSAFFMYYEELDFNIRVRKMGFRIVYTPRAAIYHKYSQSVRRFSRATSQESYRRTLLTKRYFQCINRARVILKHCPLGLFLRNLLLILGSYIYYESWFIKNAGVPWTASFNLDLVRACFASLEDRFREMSQESEGSWADWMVCRSLRWYLNEISISEERWERRLTGLHPS